MQQKNSFLWFGAGWLLVSAAGLAQAQADSVHISMNASAGDVPTQTAPANGYYSNSAAAMDFAEQLASKNDLPIDAVRNILGHTSGLPQISGSADCRSAISAATYSASGMAPAASCELKSQ